MGLFARTAEAREEPAKEPAKNKGGENKGGGGGKATATDNVKKDNVKKDNAKKDNRSLHDNVSVSSRNVSAEEEERDVPPPEILKVDLNELLPSDTLGGGNRAIPVYKAAWNRRFRSSRTVAVKIAVVSDDPLGHDPTVTNADLAELRREGKMSWPLKHKNICRLLGAGDSPQCHALVYEYCAGGSLHDLLSGTQPYEYLSIALDIANGMAYLHSKDVIHRDLKSTNVLIDENGRAKIADFGLSVLFTSSGKDLTAETGTYRWMAPEVIRHEAYSSNADV